MSGDTNNTIVLMNNISQLLIFIGRVFEISSIAILILTISIYSIKWCKAKNENDDEEVQKLLDKLKGVVFIIMLCICMFFAGYYMINMYKEL